MRYVGEHPSDFYTVEVEVTADDNAVVAVATIELDGEYVHYTASAKREPGDPRNPSIGKTLAVSRALIRLGVDLNKAANRAINQSV